MTESGYADFQIVMWRANKFNLFYNQFYQSLAIITATVCPAITLTPPPAWFLLLHLLPVQPSLPYLPPQLPMHPSPRLPAQTMQPPLPPVTEESPHTVEDIILHPCTQVGAPHCAQ